MSRPGHITHVQFADLPVDHQDRAIAFYTQLGPRVARDAPYQEGWRWVELEIPGARTRIRLSRRPATGAASAGEGQRRGGGERGGSGADEPALALEVDDVDAFHAAASAHGATFAQAPAEAPWSPGRRYALLRDSEGNTVLVQSG